MRELNPKIEIQQLLTDQINKALQGDVIDPIRRRCASQGDDAYCRSLMEGSSLKITPRILPDIDALCRGVKDTLGFDEPVDFYIVSDPTPNACAFLTIDERRPHIVKLNSGLFGLLDDRELRYVVGHELGHLINRDRHVADLFNFVYPDAEARRACPEFLLKRMNFLQPVAEFGADRYGYMAGGDFDACITAILKLSSGLSLEGRDISVEAFLEQNAERLDYFLSDEGVSEGTHPVDPMRIRALELFARAKTQKALNEGMAELLGQLQRFNYYAFDDVIADFVASAGLIMACADGRRDKSEDARILDTLARFTLFPARALRQVEKGDVNKIFEESLGRLLSGVPGIATPLFDYLVDMAFADGVLEQREADLLYSLGDRMGFDSDAVSDRLACKIRQHLVPSAAMMK